VRPNAKHKRGTGDRVSHRSRRDALLQAAIREFLRRGYQGTSLVHIIQTAGGSRRAIYEEFGDKRGLFTAAVQEICRGSASAADQAKAFELAPDKALRIFGQRLLEVLISRETLALYRMLLGEVSRFPALGRLVFDSVPETAARRLAVYLKEQTKLGVLDVKNPARAAWVFMEMLQGDVHLRALLNPRVKVSRADIRNSVNAAVDLFLNGARPRARRMSSGS
jgi:AcrR family transcriptional regulator